MCGRNKQTRGKMRPASAEAKANMTRRRYYFAARTREPRFHLARIFTGLGTVSKDGRSALSRRSIGTFSKSLLWGLGRKINENIASNYLY